MSANAKVLLPCGQLSLETVPDRLAEAGIETESVTVYETVADDSLAANVQFFISQWGKPRYIVFFSPSIVRFSHNILRELGCLQPDTRLVAIGPTTAAEMTKTLGQVDGIAEKPDPQHLCQTLTRLSLETKSPSSI